MCSQNLRCPVDFLEHPNGLDETPVEQQAPYPTIGYMPVEHLTYYAHGPINNDPDLVAAFSAYVVRQAVKAHG